MSNPVDPGSFRDPSGFIFTHQGTLYRQVQDSYRQEYHLLTSSGLYQDLVDAGLLVPHTEVSLDFAQGTGAHRVLKPERISFISYPYEWSFSQLRDAALATLQIQQRAMRCGMSLKDASAYNIQFRCGKPIMVDTLSFEKYEEGRPWVAYRQFCQHFLAPLALMSRVDVRLGQLLRIHLDGIPLDLASRLLPGGSRLDPGLLTHIHLHGAAQKRYADRPVAPSTPRARMGRTALLALVDSLEGTVRRQSWKPAGTEWGEYYGNTNYSSEAMAGKRRIVSDLLAAITPTPRMVWDLGANTGEFSRIASGMGAETIAWDIDPAAVEKNYIDSRSSGEARVLPLLQDLTNPSSYLGWALRERGSILSRGPADGALALALVHHLAIGNNVPLDRVAAFFQSMCRWLIVEFVPKSDSQVQRLLANREDVFPNYTPHGFEAAFDRYFDTVRCAGVPDSERTVYLMRAKDATESMIAG